MKWILPGLMILIIVPGLHYAGFVNLFGPSSLEESFDLDASRETPANQSRIYSPEELQVQSLSEKEDEGTFSLKQLKGQVVLLNFWASWCVPCREEFPELIEAVKWGKGGLSLVAVSVDSSKQDITKFFKQLSAKQDLRDPNIYIVWDPEFKTANQFNVVKFPETFILNQDLKIIKKLAGLFFLEKERSELIKFLPVTKPK